MLLCGSVAYFLGTSSGVKRSRLLTEPADLILEVSECECAVFVETLSKFDKLAVEPFLLPLCGDSSTTNETDIKHLLHRLVQNY